MSVPGCTMALDAIVPDPDAAMFTVGAVCPDVGFVTTKLNAYEVPAVTVCPVCTVSVKVPELHAPRDCVVLSENFVSPLFPPATVPRVTGFVAEAPARPDIVMTELAAAVKSVSVAIVTVIVFDFPAAGVLCPTALVVKDCPSAVKQFAANPNRTSNIRFLLVKCLLLRVMAPKIFSRRCKSKVKMSADTTVMTRRRRLT